MMECTTVDAATAPCFFTLAVFPFAADHPTSDVRTARDAAFVDERLQASQRASTWKRATAAGDRLRFVV